jgi:hypothetical protein
MELEKHRNLPVVVERKISIDNTKYHIKSIFTGKIKLEDALKNIALKKLRNSRQQTAV